LNSDLLDDDNFALKTFEEISKNGTNVEQTINLLVKCFNFAYIEIASDYIPLITMEKIKVKNGEFNLSELSNIIYKIVKLETKSGEIVNAKSYGNVLYAKDGEYNLYYAFVPNIATLNTEINNFNGKVLDRVFAYGINKEYTYINGLYSESESYKIKFEEALKSALSEKRNLTLPKRRWF
jgi:hypothetical protein